MKTIGWLLPLALGLAGCTTYDNPYGPQGYPEQAPYPPQGPYPPQEPYPQQTSPYPPATYPTSQGSYRAVGTEPFWDLEIGDQMTFTDRGNNIVVSQPTPRPFNGTAGEIYRTQRLEVNVNHIRCTDGMSDRTYPDTVQVFVDGKSYRGCGAPTAFYTSVDERGNAMPMPPSNVGPGTAPPLDRTRWQVIAINDRPVPRDGDYSMQFDAGKLSASFGCNRLNAGYTQNGNSLDAGAVMATRMACPNNDFEAQGLAILDRVMTIRMLDPNRLRIEAQGGSIEIVRR